MQMQQHTATLDLPKHKILELQDLGFHYVNEINRTVLEKIKCDINESNIATTTAFEAYQIELLTGCILSYNEKLDEILKNEITPGTIVDLSGGPGSGKTQICFQLCISVQMPKICGGMQGAAVYLGTNKNFASHRIREMAETFLKNMNIPSNDMKQLLTVDKILKSIFYMDISNCEELIACIGSLEDLLKENPVRLIIIDSITAPFRLLDADNNRLCLISRVIKDLRNLAKKYKLAVVFTNDLTTRVANGEAFNTPSLGDSYYHCVDCRILLNRKNSVFHAQLIKSAHSRPREGYFYIT